MSFLGGEEVTQRSPEGHSNLNYSATLYSKNNNNNDNNNYDDDDNNNNQYIKLSNK